MNKIGIPNIEPYKRTGSFVYWCQKVLPTVYNDALSYYEVLCKVVNYLNDVISNVDGLYTDINNLNSAFLALKKYVEDFLNNLHIEEEIQSVIESMVDSGEFVAIVSFLLYDKISVRANTIVGDTDNDTIQRVFTAAEVLQAMGIESVISIDKEVTLTNAITLSNTYIEDTKIVVVGMNNSRINLNGNFNLFGNTNNHYNYIFKDITFKCIGGDNNIVHDYNISNSTFQRCTFEGFNHVLYSPLFCQWVKFFDCTFHNGTGAQLLYGGAYYIQVKNCYFLECHNDYCIKQDNTIIVSSSLWSNVCTIIENNVCEKSYGFVYSNSERGLYIKNNGIEATTYCILLDRKRYNEVARSWNVVIEDNQFAGSNETLRPNTQDCLVTIKGWVGFVRIKGNMCTGAFVVDFPLDITPLAQSEKLQIKDNFFTAYINDVLTAVPYLHKSNVDDVILDIDGNGIYGSYKYGYVVRDSNDVGWVRNFGEYSIISRSGSFAVATDEDYRDLTIRLPLIPFYPISVNFGYAEGKENSMTAQSFYSDGEGNLYVRAIKTDSAESGAANKIIVTGYCVKPQYS